MKRIIFHSIIVILSILPMMCSQTPTRHILPDGRIIYKGGQKDVSDVDTIGGRIVDYQTGKGLRNADVEIKNINLGIGYYKVKTDSSGEFRVRDYLKRVEYEIGVRVDGYIIYTGRFYGNQTIRLKKEAFVEGAVKDTAENPLQGVEVSINKNYGNRNNRNSSRDATARVTNKKGFYRFNQLRGGSYAVKFNKKGYISETARIGTVYIGGTVKLPMVMYKTSSVSGAVKIKSTGTAAPNVSVALKGGKRGGSYAVSTFPDGSYIIDDVRPGKYMVHVTHNGFYKIKSGPIHIKEGTRTKNLNYTVRAKQPGLSVYAYRYTFSPINKIRFNMRTFRLEKVKIKIYRIPLSVLVKGRTDPNVLRVDRKSFRLEREWVEPVKDYRDYEWQYQTIQVNKALPTGGYCVEVSATNKLFDRKFFTVTSVGVVVKRSQNSIFTYVSSLVKNTPIKNARILVFDNTPVVKKKKTNNESSDYEGEGDYYEGPQPEPRQTARFGFTSYDEEQRIEKLPIRILYRGKTNSEGIFHHKIKSNKQLAVLAIGPDASYGFCNSGSPNVFVTEQNRFFIYTDRPVYRAGNKVHYKIMGKYARSRATAMANKKIYYEVRDPQREVIKQGSFTLDSWGTAKGTLDLEEDTSLGPYQIRAGLEKDNLFGMGRFYVEQYRKPEFNVKIHPSKEFYVNNETAVFKVTSKYLFGAPLRSAVVKYRFYESRLKDRGTLYWWESSYKKRKSYNKIKLEGQKMADDNGIAVLKLDCKNYPYDREITLEATVTDKSNISVTSKRTVRVGRGAYYVKIVPTSNFYVNKDVNKVTIKTIQQNGVAVSRKVNVKIFRYIYRPLQMVYVHGKRPIYARNITTNNKGVYVMNLPDIRRSGEYDIVINGRDKYNNRITASRVVWVYSGSGAKVASRLKNLELSVSRTRLKNPGEVTCLIKSRFPNSSVCLTLEGRDIYDSKVVKLKGHMGTVKFRIKDSYAPNLFVTAVLQKNRALYSATEGVSIPKGDTRLIIKMEPDKEKYLPGEKATVRITAKDERGNPVGADISLGCVDEAIYLIRSDHTATMLDFFYQRISNWVLTSYSYPMTLLAGAIKTAILQIRERFEDTAFWSANIRTGTDGRATVTFELPDNLTTWRLTARGHDKQGRVGERRRKFMVTQDLVARIGKPRFLIEKDTLSLIGIINSNAGRGLPKVSTEFKLDGKKLNPDKKISISLPPYGSARNFYTFTVPEKMGEMTLFFKAIADKDAKDALRIKLPVQSRGTPYKFYGIGDLLNTSRVELKPLGDTDNFEYRPNSITITLNPGPIERMLRASKYLKEYRYGCIEQLTSKTIPLALFKNLLDHRNLGHLMKDKGLEERVKWTIRHVLNAQNDDGSWGWFPSSHSNLWVTSYVLQNLKLASDIGYKVNKDSVDKGLRAINRGINNMHLGNDSLAYTSYVYSMWGNYNEGGLNRLLAIKKANPYQIAFTLRTLANLRYYLNIDDKYYKEKRDLKTTELKGMMQKDNLGIYWNSIGRQRFGWQGANNEISAYVLSALVESGDTSPIPAQLVQSLIKRGHGDGWLSTKETAAVMYSLCSYLEKTGTRYSSKGRVKFMLNGKYIAEIPYDMKAPKIAGTLSRKVKLEPSMFGGNFVIQGEGQSKDVSFDCVMNGHLYYKDSGFLSLFSSEESSLKSLSNGISLVRSYHKILRVRDVNNREYMVPQRMQKGDKIKVGDEILVKIRFKSMDNFNYIMLEDFLPAGFEVVKKDAYESNAKDYVRAERWDNRMIYYYDKTNKGQLYDLAYILRAELPGRFIAKPTRMECMYEPSIQGWSKAAKFIVEKK